MTETLSLATCTCGVALACAASAGVLEPLGPQTRIAMFPLVQLLVIQPVSGVFVGSFVTSRVGRESSWFRTGVVGMGVFVGHVLGCAIADQLKMWRAVRAFRQQAQEEPCCVGGALPQTPVLDEELVRDLVRSRRWREAAVAPPGDLLTLLAITRGWWGTALPASASVESLAKILGWGDPPPLADGAQGHDAILTPWLPVMTPAQAKDAQALRTALWNDDRVYPWTRRAVALYCKEPAMCTQRGGCGGPVRSARHLPSCQINELISQLLRATLEGQRGVAHLVTDLLFGGVAGLHARCRCV